MCLRNFIARVKHVEAASSNPITVTHSTDASSATYSSKKGTFVSTKTKPKRNRMKINTRTAASVFEILFDNMAGVLGNYIGDKHAHFLQKTSKYYLANLAAFKNCTV